MEFLSQTDVIILSLGTLILGMAILVKGGDWTIDSAVEIARHYGMPPLLVGFTIVAFGTSLPELIASINANISGLPAIAVGGMIGSNISNILLVGGVCAAITPLVGKISALRNDMIALILVTLGWSYLIATSTITPMFGFIAIGLLIAYVFLQYTLSKTNPDIAAAVLDEENHIEQQAPKTQGKAFIMLLGGLIGLAVGAELLIRGAVTTARIMDIPESVIGLTIVAIGTSLPELTTCAIAAMKRQGDMILGNIIGSNIFNLMMVLGGIAMIQPYSMVETEARMIHQDLPIMIGVTGILIATLIIFKRIPRVVGGVFALSYLGYIMLLAYQTI